MTLVVSGNVDVTNMVLEAGVKMDLTNSVNRTAAQMAAFVGQHQCVRAINNFFPKQELEKFTVPRGVRRERGVCVCVCNKAEIGHI